MTMTLEIPIDRGTETILERIRNRHINIMPLLIEAIRESIPALVEDAEGLLS